MEPSRLNTRLRRHAEAGFGIFLALVVLLLIGFIAAVVMSYMRIRWALLAFVVSVVVLTFITAFPDIKRYSKISSM